MNTVTAWMVDVVERLDCANVAYRFLLLIHRLLDN
jgi:hypothetical protein